MRDGAGGVLLAPLGVERDRLRRPRLPARLHAPGPGRASSPTRARRSAARTRSGPCGGGGGSGETPLRALAKGGLGPRDNDSRFLLDLHRRGLPGRATMASYRDDDEVDLVIVGAGAGGSTLAQRLARAGLADRDPRVGPVLGPRPRLGLRRGRLRTSSTGPPSG